jgi:Flp pilus assembly pilin Flp
LEKWIGDAGAEYYRAVVGSIPPNSNYGKETCMKNLLKKLWQEEEGQDLTEYALLLVLLSLAAVGSLSALATAINGVFSKASANLT